MLGRANGENNGSWATLAAWLAASRVLFGLAAALAPAAVARTWLGPTIDTTAADVPTRALGGRDVVLGVGALLGLWRGGDAPRWLRGAAAADTMDALATTVTAGRRGVVRSVIPAVVALGSAAVQLLVARHLVRRAPGTANPTAAPLPTPERTGASLAVIPTRTA